jgi:membrane associated rhomboid family serine protease
MRTTNDIRISFTGSEGLLRLLAVNIAVFLVLALSKMIFFLSGSSTAVMEQIISLLGMTSSVSQLAMQPWSLITYMFVHESFLHILFNMLTLFWFGKIFCEYFNSRKIVVVYLLGGIAGALLYFLAYQLFPVFESVRHASTLIGASAGVIAVLVAISTLLPDYSMQLLLFGAVRLKYIAGFMVLLYLISIPDGNAGGNISHLGGALFGFVYTRLYRQGTDAGAWLEKLLAWFSGLFRPSSKIKVVHRKSGTFGDLSQKEKPRQEVIDAILDKISRSGYGSLSDKEKDILFKASKGKD